MAYDDWKLATPPEYNEAWPTGYARLEQLLDEMDEDEWLDLLSQEEASDAR